MMSMDRKKELGSFYTPQCLADWIVKRIAAEATIQSVLEPSCGDGSFISALNYFNRFLNITAVDIDDKAVKAVTEKYSGINIYCEDFLFSDIKEKFDLIIGNPPYISKRNISQTQIEKCKSIHALNGLKSKEIHNIWTAFVLKSCSLVNPTGIISFVLPAEFLQVKYAKEIRDFIIKNFTRTEILSFRNFKFDDTEQNTIILIAYKTTSKDKGLFFHEINSIDELGDHFVFHKAKIDIDMKWTANCLNTEELCTIHKILNNKNVKKVESYCSAVAGIVTAANSFFVLNKETVDKYKLEKYVVPIIQKGLFVNGNICFNCNNFDKLENDNLPCFLLNLSGVSEKNFSSSLKEYLQQGVNKEINKRYKCIRRQRWYDVPSIWYSEGFFFKRSDKYPKMLVNDCNIYVTDSAYRVQMKDGYNIKQLTYSFYNTFTLLMAEIMGRSYGGGVLELTPNEFKNLPLVYINEKINFSKFSKQFSEKKDITDILQKNDEYILKKVLKLTEKEILLLQTAYDRIRKRRLL